MKYANIINAFYGSVWAILPEKHAEIRNFLRTKAVGGNISAKKVKKIMASKRSDDGVQIFGKVAVLPCMGVISQRVGMMERASGGVSTEDLGAALDNLCGDKSVRCIVMAFDSPGGSVFGVPELAAKIRARGAEKKIVAYADPMAASAAYWLAASCSEVYVTASGVVGSIGVICAHDDITEALKMEGIKTTLVTSSKYKAEGYPEIPMDDEAREEMQSKVNSYHSQFVDDVAKGRGVSVAKVEKDFGQGRMMTAQQAVAAGAADKVMPFEKLLKSLGAEMSPTAAAELPEIEANRKRALARARLVEISS